ncbi:dimethylarginine dimethylaminohydrolase family protein [Desulfoluna butyratoxydans]|uniref:Amidinotransferase n=1 Tax=Desulfoluna butyratoxydans TaxID=231438 RepID=A0A4U8YMJ5_9BACT|nr:arginine deiminase-related protein [Desulfoluna butyratoxydans]VFQ45275.1 amidinotransferase [Desulfoluna butyratoxydans]
MFQKAIVRKPCKNFANGITTQALGAPDYDTMLAQHAAYVQALKDLGIAVEELEAEEAYPDAHFVEDTAVVFPEAAVITNPGADARKGEEVTIEKALAAHRTLEKITAPGTVDGGDILMVDRHFFIGVSDRTNQEGASQLGDIVSRHGYTWTPVPVAAGLHFKSSVNYVGKNTLLVTDAFKDRSELKDYTLIVLDPEEEYAGNTLLINDTLIMPKGFPKTRAKLEALELPIVELDTSETRKMDGGLTCLSLRF